MQKTILCVDDELYVRESLGFWLEDRNYRVFKAQNGKIALDIYQKEKIDLIIVDLSMPEFDGFSLMKSLNEKNAKTPVIVLSGTGMIRDVVEAHRLGANYYITKPIEDFDILACALDHCFEAVKLVGENQLYKEKLEELVSLKTAELSYETKIAQDMQKLSQSIILESDFEIVCQKIAALFKEYFSFDYCNFLYEIDGVVKASQFNDLSQQKLALLASSQNKIQVIADPDFGQILFFPMQVSKTDRGVITLARKISGFSEKEINLVERVSIIYKFLIKRKKLELAIEKEQEIAKNALKAKSSFISQMSHELRTPLGAAMGMLELIQQSNNLKDMHTFVDDAIKSSNQLLDLINQILKFCSLSENNFTPNYSQFLVKNVVNDICLQYKRAIDKKGLELKIDFDPSLNAFFISDLDAFRKIIENLLDNAIKFTKQGFIALSFVNKEENSLLIAIKDTGVGIDQNHHNYIFEQFTQLENVYTRTNGGVGLGLPISKELVTKLNGEIYLESSLGSGSTFFVKLPEFKGING